MTKLRDPHRYQPDPPYTPKIDSKRCRASVSDTNSFRSRQCGNRHKPGSEWCKSHDPQAAHDRALKRDRVWREKQDRIAARRRERAEAPAREAVAMALREFVDWADAEDLLADVSTEDVEAQVAEILDRSIRTVYGREDD